MNFTPVTIVFIVAALQSLIAGMAFFIMRRENGPLHPRLLGVLFLLIASSFIDATVDRLGGYLQFPQFAFIASIFALGIPAVLYFYSRAITIEHFRFRWYDIFHAAPVLITGAIALFEYHSKSRDEQLAFWRDGYEESALVSPYLSAFLLSALAIQIVMLILRMQRNHEALKQVRSNPLDESFIILKGFGIAYIGVIILNAIYSYLLHNYGPQSLSVVEFLIGLWSYLLISALLLGLMLKPERRMALTDEEVAITGFEQVEKSVSPGTEESESEYWHELDETLESYMRTQRPYLDANLTLLQLARKLGVPGRELSSYINQRLKQNFSEYIANWRIEEFQRQLLDASFDGSITDAMYECGFNSKSTFNSNFKKVVGMTPSQWRDQAIMKKEPGKQVA